MEERNGRLIGLELRDAAGTGGEVPLQIRVDLRRQMVLDEIREETHEIGAATLSGTYGQVSAGSGTPDSAA